MSTTFLPFKSTMERMAAVKRSLARRADRRFWSVYSYRPSARTSLLNLSMFFSRAMAAILSWDQPPILQLSLQSWSHPLPEGQQGYAVDLAVRVLRDGVDEDDGRRHLERGEPGPTVFVERRPRCAPPRPERDEADRHLAVDVVLHAERGGIGHVGVLE